MASDDKSAAAFRTIGEVAAATGIAPHVLRYWEARFAQLKPVTRAGNRRYYRPEDVRLIERIDRLLHHDGYTLRGVQHLLAAEAKGGARATGAGAGAAAAELRAIRDELAKALAAD